MVSGPHCLGARTTNLFYDNSIRVYVGYLFHWVAPLFCIELELKLACVIMCARLAVFFLFKINKIKEMSTKPHMIPSSVFCGKENSILRKEDNKTI